MAPAADVDAVDDAETSTAFSVLKQKLELDFSFSPRRIKGKTTLEIQPQDEHLRYIELNCRQLNITSVKVDGHDATSFYSNLYQRLALHPGTDIHQHHFMKMRLQRHAGGGESELEIIVPDAVKIKRMNPEDATEDQILANSLGAEGGDLYTPIKLEIEYVVENARDAVQFVGVEDGDARYPHVYTRNSPFPGIASCLFPCIDDGTTKCIFDVTIRYPRTLGDVYSKERRTTVIQGDGSPKADSVMSDVDDDPAEFSEEEKALEMAVICSGELTDDITDPTNPTRRTASFTCATPVLPQHIGISLGPFEHVDLSEYRDNQDDERLGSNAIRVHAFALPGRADEVRNSAMMLAKTLDSFTERYQSYPFEKAYKLAFVDELDCDVAHSASFSICSSRLLFPAPVWEPLEETTRALVHAVASQWIGVNVTPQRPHDHWIIVGGSWFMAELYLRDLFGRNDHRFRQKMMSDKIIELDVRRAPLYDLGDYLQVDPGEMEFMILKAPMVLAILHHRLVKQSGKNGVDRCLYRLLFNARNEKLPNGIISTEAWMDICEKVGHQKLDTFFNQWVYSSGCPIFECHPAFNKKKQVIQLTIKQTQADPTLRPEDRPLSDHDVMREAKEKYNGFRPSTEFPAFVGPMTIRIHEADGTPYEHIVDINSSNVKVEIPYNTKYKRLKKTRRQKERMAAAQGLDASGETQEDTIIYMLGDVLDTKEEMQEWQISDWSQEDENRMDQEFYEWIRVDADFEWICRANINDMPSYMYVSQLQQDKDVVAQAESIQWLALKEGHPLISSILVKTLMDSRYFHGIRTMAADVIALSAKKTLNWIGLFHLKKAFQDMFCIEGSPMTRSNDFSERERYVIQCAIPKAIAKIKGTDGRAPMEVKRFLLDIMRYNDNRGNDYSDDHYLATIMLCLAQSLTTAKKNAADHDLNLNSEDEVEEYEFKRKALEELGRHQRLDEWIPTYQNIYTTTALECGLILQRNRSVSLKASDFLQYTRIGNADNVRLKAWECLVQLSVVRRDNVLKYMIQEIASDPSPYFRAGLIRLLDTALGQIAIGDEFKPEKIIDPGAGGLVIQQEETMLDRQAQIARQRLDGALRALKAELANNPVLKESLEEALHSRTTSARDVFELLEICSIFYLPISKLHVVLKKPRYWGVEHLGNGQLRFYQTNRYREKPIINPKALLPQPKTEVPLPAPSEAGPPKIKLKMKTKLASAEEQLPSTTPAEPKPPVMVPQKSPVVLPPKPPVPAGEPKKPKILPPKPSGVAASPAPSSAPIPSPKTAPPTVSLPPPPTPLPPVTTPIPTPPAPSPRPAPPAPTPKIRINTAKPQASPSATPSTKRSRIIILRVAPEKLRGLPHDQRLTPGTKRKAANAPEGDAQRALKRQASADLVNGTGSPGPMEKRMVVKLNIGKNKLEKLRREKGI